MRNQPARVNPLTEVKREASLAKKKNVVIAQTPWLEVHKYSNRACYYLRDTWLGTPEGQAFRTALTSLCFPGKDCLVGAEFQGAVNLALSGSDAQVFEFFHNQKGYFIPSVLESNKKPLNVPDFAEHQLTADENKIWRSLDTLFSSGERSPCDYVYRRLKTAVETSTKLDTTLHHFWLVMRLREIALHYWNACEQYQQKPDMFFPAVVDTQLQLKQIGYDIQVLNNFDLRNLYKKCCRAVTTYVAEVSSKGVKQGNALQHPIGKQCVMCPGVTLERYQNWLRKTSINSPARYRYRLMEQVMNGLRSSGEFSSVESVQESWDAAMENSRRARSQSLEDLLTSSGSCDTQGDSSTIQTDLDSQASDPGNDDDRDELFMFETGGFSLPDSSPLLQRTNTLPKEQWEIKLYEAYHSKLDIELLRKALKPIFTDPKSFINKIDFSLFYAAKCNYENFLREIAKSCFSYPTDKLMAACVDELKTNFGSELEAQFDWLKEQFLEVTQSVRLFAGSPTMAAESRRRTVSAPIPMTENSPTLT